MPTIDRLFAIGGLMLFIVSVVIIAILIVTKCGAFIYAVYAKRSSPTLSTWLIWLCATAISATTYALSKKEHLLSGIIVLADFASVAAIVTAILVWVDRRVRFRPFEKWYLLGCAAIVAYGLVTGNAFESHLFSQGLIAIGYVPMYHTLIREKQRTEAYVPWLMTLATAGIGLVPAILGRDVLAGIYAARGGIQVLLVLGLMVFCDLRTKRGAASAT